MARFDDLEILLKRRILPDNITGQIMSQAVVV